MSSKFDASKLSRVTLKKNPKYEKSGIKSYAYALNKCKNIHTSSTSSEVCVQASSHLAVTRQYTSDRSL